MCLKKIISNYLLNEKLMIHQDLIFVVKINFLYSEKNMIDEKRYDKFRISQDEFILDKIEM